MFASTVDCTPDAGQKEQKILDTNPQCHCAAQSLNLAVCDAAKTSPTFMTFFGNLSLVYSVFSGSIQRWAILREHVETTVQREGETSWESRIEIDAVTAMRRNFQGVCRALKEVLKETNVTATASAEIKRVIKHLKSFNFYMCFGIKCYIK